MLDCVRMSRYEPGDDGKTIDGKIVVFLRSPPPGAGDSAGGPALARAQAAALVAAAQAGTPFCEECEQARRKLASKE